MLFNKDTSCKLFPAWFDTKLISEFLVSKLTEAYLLPYGGMHDWKECSHNSLLAHDWQPGPITFASVLLRCEL